MSDRRRLMEVLKWVPPEDNLSNTSLVSRLWFEASENEEVWASLSHDYDITPHRPENQSFKEGFHQLICGLLPVLCMKSLKVFNCLSRTVIKEITFDEKILVAYQIAAVMLDEGGLIVCGGVLRNLAIYISPAGAFQRLHRMKSQREFHSVASVRDTLYVFGGDKSSNRTAEKLRTEPLATLAERDWQSLPDSLLSHAACQPCVHRTLIYLCGGNNDKSEVFDTASEEYAVLPFTLPESLYGCVSFYRSGELIIFTTDYVSRWQSGGEIKSKKNAMMCSGIWTNMKQVLIGNSLFSSEIGTVRIFDLLEGSRYNLQAFS